MFRLWTRCLGRGSDAVLRPGRTTCARDRCDPIRGIYRDDDDVGAADEHAALHPVAGRCDRGGGRRRPPERRQSTQYLDLIQADIVRPRNVRLPPSYSDLYSIYTRMGYPSSITNH